MQALKPNIIKEPTKKGERKEGDLPKALSFFSIFYPFSSLIIQLFELFQIIWLEQSSINQRPRFESQRSRKRLFFHRKISNSLNLILIIN